MTILTARQLRLAATQLWYTAATELDNYVTARDSGRLNYHKENIRKLTLWTAPDIYSGKVAKMYWSKAQGFQKKPIVAFTKSTVFILDFYRSIYF